jgi:hypothetical protein
VTLLSLPSAFYFLTGCWVVFAAVTRMSARRSGQAVAASTRAVVAYRAVAFTGATWLLIAALT